MNEVKKKTIERLENYILLIKSLKEDNIEKRIDEKYKEYLNLARRKVQHEKNR